MNIDNKFVPKKADLIEFAARKEPWCEYELEDGTIIRLRVFLSKIVRSDLFDENGFPVLNLQFQQVTDVTWPDEAIAAAAKRRTQC